VNAGSQFNVVFQIAVPCSYSLTGSVYGGGSYGPTPPNGPGFSLIGPTGTIFQVVSTIQDATQPFSTAGILPPGQYLISGTVTTLVQVVPYASGSFTLDLELAPFPFQVTSITIQSNTDVVLTWNAFGGMTNLVQASNCGPGGSNSFVAISPPIIIPTNVVGVSTNYTDLGGAINTSCQTYRVVDVVGQQLTIAPLAISPVVLDFGTVTPGATTQQVFVVNNISAVNVWNGQATATGDASFTIVSGSPFALPPLGSTNVVVQFAPVSPGSYTGALVVSDEYGFVATNQVTGGGFTCVSFLNSNGTNGTTWGPVTAGQLYSYEGGGYLFVGKGCRYDPNGHLLSGGTCSTGTADATFICPGLAAYSLVGKVNGQCIQLGTQGSFMAPDSGTLTLYFNKKTSDPVGAGAFSACINPGPIAAYFGASPVSGSSPLPVSFIDQSTGTITNRFWDFGDGVTTNLSSAGVVHTYTGAGTYPVSLTASGPSGANTSVQPNLIVVMP
jgi:hypothetical protein